MASDIYRAAMLYHRMAGVETEQARAAFATADARLQEAQRQLHDLEAALETARNFGDREAVLSELYARYELHQKQKIDTARVLASVCEAETVRLREILRACAAEERAREEPVLLHAAELRTRHEKQAEHRQEEDCAFRYRGR